mmetsp:Transcript_12413/g.19701  ORF Transcript_12413/g.19701 Transcript_12413/m.19701 type:complete len:169 (-) Transcript_12413:614-1120(-)
MIIQTNRCSFLTSKIFNKYTKPKFYQTKLIIPQKNYYKTNFISHCSKDNDPIMNQMTISFHINELRERVLLILISMVLALLLSFSISKEILKVVEVAGLENGFSFIQLTPGEFFFTSLEVSAYSTVATAFPTFLYHVISYILPGLTIKEKNFYVPTLLLSSLLFYCGF